MRFGAASIQATVFARYGQRDHHITLCLSFFFSVFLCHFSWVAHSVATLSALTHLIDEMGCSGQWLGGSVFGWFVKARAYGPLFDVCPPSSHLVLVV